MTMPDLALRWILAEPTVSTIIPGMRKIKHVDANLAASDGQPLDASLLETTEGAPLGPNPDGLVPVSSDLAMFGGDGLAAFG